ncbi:MAG TPA: GtrA family protein [Hyphomicrobiales bacterium]|nr:GtrA family protein [Hyphomicrobiales bacterium]
MQQVVIFIAVGSAAALTHLVTVAFLVEFFALPPLVANIFGFGAAFLVSFGGHARWTFPIAPERLQTARHRFFAVACAGFLFNQLAYAEMLHLVGARYYLPALAAVLLAVAVSTFLLSKLWAFAEP